MVLRRAFSASFLGHAATKLREEQNRNGLPIAPCAADRLGRFSKQTSITFHVARNWDASASWPSGGACLGEMRICYRYPFYTFTAETRSCRQELRRD